VPLEKGTLNSEPSDQINKYFSLFDEASISKSSDFIREFRKSLFDRIDIRTQIQLIDRASLIHRVFIKERSDASILCFEMFWITMVQYYKIATGQGFLTYDIDYAEIFRRWNDTKPRLPESMKNYFNDIFRKIPVINRSDADEHSTYFIIDKTIASRVFWLITKRADPRNAVHHYSLCEQEAKIEFIDAKYLELLNTLEKTALKFDEMVQLIY
jgi:hypothetical protein